MHRSIKLVIESDLAAVPLLGGAIHWLCASVAAASEADAQQIELCCVEAANNAIEHAYGSLRGRDVEVVFEHDDASVTLRVLDDGAPMDPDILERARFPSEPSIDTRTCIPERGRGLAIMKAVMDSVAYRQVDGKNCLMMTKRLSTAVASESGSFAGTAVRAAPTTGGSTGGILEPRS